MWISAILLSRQHWSWVNGHEVVATAVVFTRNICQDDTLKAFWVPPPSLSVFSPVFPASCYTCKVGCNPGIDVRGVCKVLCCCTGNNMIHPSIKLSIHPSTIHSPIHHSSIIIHPSIIHASMHPSMHSAIHASITHASIDPYIHHPCIHLSLIHAFIYHPSSRHTFVYAWIHPSSTRCSSWVQAQGGLLQPFPAVIGQRSSLTLHPHLNANNNLKLT